MNASFTYRFATCSFWICLVLASMCLPLTASAQRFGSRTSTLVSLAANEAVQKELGIAGGAAAKLEELNDKFRDAAGREYKRQGIDYSALSDLPALERAAEMRKVSEKTAELNRKLSAQFQPDLDQMLSPQQIERLKQIQLQAAGIDAWLEPEAAKQLELSDEQRQKLADLKAAYSRKAQRLDGEFQERLARTRELNAQRDRQAIDLLSDSQQANLKQLQGAPFDVNQLNSRRRGNN